jgi:flagellar protein FlgJ
MSLLSLAHPAMLEAGVQAGLQVQTAAAAAKNGARGQAEAFEASFLSTMFQTMFTGIGEEGPLGNAGAGMWRSFLTEEYAKQVAKAGGVGLADQVYNTLIAHQAAKSVPQTTGAAAP